MQNSQRKKTFFASDFHLGVDARLTSAERERQVVRWLDSVAPEAEAIYLVGDLFEFWFEYNSSQKRPSTAAPLVSWFRNFVVLRNVSDPRAIVTQGAVTIALPAAPTYVKMLP